jgi:hypothetical protein
MSIAHITIAGVSNTIHKFHNALTRPVHNALPVPGERARWTEILLNEGRHACAVVCVQGGQAGSLTVSAVCRHVLGACAVRGRQL